MFLSFRKSKITYLLLATYLAFVVWWLLIYHSGIKDGTQNLAFGLAYSFVSLFGGILGLLCARAWGGFRSQVGRGLNLLSLGLLALTFGQMVFSYYNFVAHVEIPFPSAADFGYLAITIFYALGGLAFLKAAGGKFSLRTLRGKITILVIPAIMLVASYFLFFSKLSPDPNPIATFLIYGTPVGQLFYISIALLTYQLSRGLLGGVMRRRILFLVLALVTEYAAEYTFFLRFGTKTYYNGDISDLLFVTAIIIMSLGLNSFRLNKNRADGNGSI